MKIIGIEDTEEIKKKLDRKKLIIKIIIVLIIIIAVIIASTYIANVEFRDFVDLKILGKSAQENNVPFIEIEEGQNNIYAYDKYIVILKDNKLIHYNSNGKEELSIDMQISNPVIDINNRFLIIGEKDKQKLYLISGGNKVWEKDAKDIEGNISRVCVNKNGYSAIILSGTTHKSVIELFDSAGKKIFRTYLSNTLALDVDISNDNKYMSFAELNTNGTKISSSIKTISIEKAKDNSSDSIVNTYETKQDSLILNIKYQDQNKLVCMYDTNIYINNDGNETELISKEDMVKNSFIDIELNNNIVKVADKSSFLKSKSDIEIINVNNKNSNLYIIDGVVKQIYCFDSKIALNLGTEVHFIGTNGWLIKKYMSKQEIKDIVMCNNFAGIVYRNKIEIVGL